MNYNLMQNIKEKKIVVIVGASFAGRFTTRAILKDALKYPSF
jgi:ABC-type phosphate/phosphonate transport system ATPase subunit